MTNDDAWKNADQLTKKVKDEFNLASVYLIKQHGVYHAEKHDNDALEEVCW